MAEKCFMKHFFYDKKTIMMHKDVSSFRVLKGELFQLQFSQYVINYDRFFLFSLRSSTVL